VEKHTFSVELKSKEYLKRVAIPEDAGDNVQSRDISVTGGDRVGRRVIRD